MEFGHEKLEVYKVSLEFVSYAMELADTLKGDYRHARDQLIRSSQSIPLNIAEGNGKRSYGDRKRFFEIARGSAMESAATLDVLVCCGACAGEQVERGKMLLVRIVSMLSKMTEPPRGVSVRERREHCDVREEGDYDYDYDYDYDHDHDHEHEGTGERYSP
jgi:four helix bundle protein